MNILVINGPNLNLLGIREPHIYGSDTLGELMAWVENSQQGRNHNFKFYQSNSEGEIINILHDERLWAQGIIMNPGAYGHYSYAIFDAIKAIEIPTVEVHISDTENRESFRKNMVISPACIATIIGKGKNSYIQGVSTLNNQHTKRNL
jgi:3-dehydroquinate dehydratase-2